MKLCYSTRLEQRKQNIILEIRHSFKNLFFLPFFFLRVTNKTAVDALEIGIQEGVLKEDRVRGFFSSCPNWDPQPSPAGECVPPPLWFRGGHTRLRERGPNSDKGADTVLL